MKITLTTLSWFEHRLEAEKFRGSSWLSRANLDLKNNENQLQAKGGLNLPITYYKM